MALWQRECYDATCVLLLDHLHRQLFSHQQAYAAIMAGASQGFLRVRNVIDQATVAQALESAKRMTESPEYDHLVRDSVS